jgi:hypothetical protein
LFVDAALALLRRDKYGRLSSRSIRLFAGSGIELARAFEPVQDGRIYIKKINGPFLFELKGTPAVRVLIAPR